MNYAIETLDHVLSSNQNFLANFGLGVIVVFVVKKLADFSSDVFNHYGGAIFVKNRLNGYGKYAVITGCTKGLGLEFARQLAEKGLNLILIARNRIELEKVSQEIENKHKINVIRVVFDLSSNENYSEILKIIDQQNVGILINNAGLMYEYPEYFHDVPDKVLNDIISVNVSASQRISHYVLKNQMVPRKKGLVVFLSSSACQQLTPMMTGYSSSKKYIEYMTKCLRCEYSGSGIFVQTLLPYYIATDMTKYSDALNKPSLLSPSPETYVRNAIYTFGFVHETTGYLPHTVMRWCSSLIPERIWTFSAIYLMKYFRRSGQKKKLQ